MMIDIKELRRLAEAATPGEWLAADQIVFTIGQDSKQSVACCGQFRNNGECCGNGYPVDEQFQTQDMLAQASPLDADYIAAANPSAILSLLDHIATLEQESAANLQRALVAEKKVDQLLQHCDDAECYTCGKIICPHEEPLHFHHDGCPACADADASTQEVG